MRVVVVADPFTSKLITSRALVDRLRQEGQEAQLRVPPGRLDDDAMLSLGVAVDLEDLRVEPPDRPGPTPEAIRTCQEQLAGDEADLYLIDIEAHEYVFAALGAGLPVGLLNVLFNLWKRPGVPPIHQDVVPGRGLQGSRVGIEYGWAGFRAKGLPSTVRSKVKRDDRRHHLLAMARDLGLRPRGLVTEFQNLIPFQYRTLPALCVSLPELELPGAVHPLNQYVGPMPNVAGVGMEPADAVVAEIDAFRREHADRRLIYGAFGGCYRGDDLPFWRRAVAAVGQRDDWIGIFGLGGRIDPADLAPLPENVRVFSWAPQMRVLERADCAVVHAGMTSVYECLHHRVPMVVFPIGESFDQFGTAARVACHGVVPVGDRDTATAADIQTLIDETLSNPRYRDRVEALGDAIDRHRDNRALTTAIEAMAGVASPSA